MNRKNLELLADYLNELPYSYGHFNMLTYNLDADEQPSGITGNHCGTAACAIGHAVYIKEIPRPLRGESWSFYSERIFGLDSYSPEWGWCFDARWSQIDNTPKGAATRIRALLNDDMPEEWEYMSNDEVEEFLEAYPPNN